MSVADHVGVPVAATCALSRWGYVGFDLDHTLARYKLDTFLPWLYDLIRSHVVEHGGFPSRLLEVEFDVESVQKALVFDAELGHFLKIGSRNADAPTSDPTAATGPIVLAASHGFPSRMLSASEIAAAYPLGAVGFDGSRHARWHTFHTYFELPAQQLVAVMVECIDRGEVAAAANPAPPTGGKYGSIFPALIGAFEFHLASSHRGGYFPAFHADPARFLHQRSEVASWLRALKRQGKFLFLVTNSRLDYTKLLAAYSFGPEWTQLFDLIIADAKKPSFFMADGVLSPQGVPNQSKPFYFPNAELVANVERVATLNDLRVKHDIFIHGNAAMLQTLFETIEAEKATVNGTTPATPQVIYFGDHIHADCVATREYTSWSAGAIVEEIEPHHDDEEGNETRQEGAAKARRKHQTFYGLHEKKHAETSHIFGSFFHHHHATAAAASGETDASTTDATVAEPVWSFWHNILTVHCDVVVGCLTDLVDEEVHGKEDLAAAAAVVPPSPASSTTSSSSSSNSPPSPAPVAPAPAVVTGPRLNSSCVHPPTVVRFQPPSFGEEFDSAVPTPAQLAHAPDATPEPVQLQYSLHKVPSTLKQELRAIFPELSEKEFAAGSVTKPLMAPLSAAQFRSLPVLAIPTFQHATVDLVEVTPEVEREKNRLLESFYAWSKRVCRRLRDMGAWADLVDPCSGYPLLGPHGSSIYSEVDSAAILLAYRMEQVGNCSMVDHPTWGFAHYPATMLTTATVEQAQQAVKEVQEEMAIRD